MSNNKRLLLELSLMQMCGLALGMMDDSEAEKKRIDLKKNEVPESLLTEKQSFAKPPLSTSINTQEFTTPEDASGTPVVREESDLEKPAPDIQEPSKVAQKEAPSPSIKRKINRGFTKELGFVLNEDEKKAVPEEDPTSYMIGKDHITDPIDKGKLQELITEFTNQLDDQPSLQSVLRAEIPELINDSEVEFKLYTEAQKQDLMKHAESLHMRMRTQLNNYQIKIKTTILAGRIFKADGPIEKFERMAQKNPNLKKLKDQLNLEIEF